MKFVGISHPVYETCSRCEPNGFWKMFFLNLAHRKTPKCLFITQDGSLLKYKKSALLSTLLVSVIDENGVPKSATVLADEVKKAVKSVGICPKKENKLEQHKIVYDTWKSIRNKGVKDFYILQYVSNLQGSAVERKMTYHRLLFEIMLGNITSKDIVFVDGKIKNIKGYEK
jgi:hypothetical protein